ncbi:MAG: hypothetical protein ABIL58_06485 [Pseudomonadota bacterium]
MKKEDIVFFDKLGFGWVVDKQVLRSLFVGPDARHQISEHLLFSRVYREKHPTK